MKKTASILCAYVVAGISFMVLKTALALIILMVLYALKVEATPYTQEFAGNIAVILGGMLAFLPGRFAYRRMMKPRHGTVDNGRAGV